MSWTLFHLISVICLVRPWFPFCGLDRWNKHKFNANPVGQARPYPSFCLPLEASVLSKSGTFPCAGSLLSCWVRFYLSFERGTMFLSGNLSGVSHCFHHVYKATALKLWAEPCQIQLLLPGNLQSPPAVHLALETQLLGPIDWILALDTGFGL